MNETTNEYGLQWSLHGAGHYALCGRTVPALPAGAYSCSIPDFPDGSAVSAWRLRLFPGKPSVSDPSLPERQRNPMGDSHNDPPAR